MSISKILRKMFSLVDPINAIILKKERNIVFYSNLGFRDNVKAVYDYCVEHGYNEKYHLICVCPDYKKFSHKLKYQNVKFVGNKAGFFYFLISKYFFYSFGKYPVRPAKTQMVVNLWHGSPLKGIGFLNNNEEHVKQNYFNYVLAASPLFVPVMKNSFGVKDEQVLICGHARNDKMFHKMEKINDMFEFSKYSKILMWLPTYKKAKGARADIAYHITETTLPIFFKWEELKELSDYLAEKNILLVIKLHPLQEWNEANVDNKFSNIVFFTQKRFENENLDLYELLAYSDALITDYSSVYFDYLLLDRPIGFTIQDLNSYSNTRGFIFDNPLDYMPGKKVMSKQDFMDFIDDCCQGIDMYGDERKKVNDLCNYYKDSHNGRRILDMVGIEYNG